MASKKQKPKARAKAAADKIETQRRRALRPSLPTNTHANVSESLVERKRREERQAMQREEFEDL